ncbi:MAG: hypothetical protein C0518_05465 [Opitutus sp.]|nr:hypothetical protein [Opitutus sp.]
MNDPTAMLQIRALVKNDTTLVAHLAEVAASAPTVADASLALTHWHHAQLRLEKREQLLRSETSLFLSREGGARNNPTASHLCHDAKPVARIATPSASSSTPIKS